MNSDKEENGKHEEIPEILEEVTSKFSYDENMPNIWKKPNAEKDEEINDLYICWKEFKIKPSKVSVFSEFNSDLLWDIINNAFEIKDKSINKISEIIPDDEGYSYNTKYLLRINKDLYISFLEFDKMPSNNDSFCSNMVFYYNQLNFSVEDLNELLVIFQSAMDTQEVNSDGEENNIFSISLNQNNQLELVTMNLESDKETDIDKFYENSTIKKVRKLVKRVNKKDKGLHILCGPRGCGKTNFLHRTLSKFKKKVIYVPLTMLEHTFNNIDFVDFLSVNKDSVIIVDDCENYFNKMHQKSNIYVSNVLQLLDSISSDKLNVHVLLSMNVESDLIDSNLLDCNNFLSIVEFDKLNGKKAKKLSKKLGFNKDYTNATKLSDIIKDKSVEENKKYL